jgi:hypothetical protein
MGCCLSRTKEDKLKSEENKNTRVKTISNNSMRNDEMVDIVNIEAILIKKDKYNSQSSFLISNGLDINEEEEEGK